jgi:DNA-binding transcriptional ArsR family regulator
MKPKDPEIGRIFHALGDPTRRAILEQLTEAPCSVSRLAEPFAMSLAAIVQHLQILEEAGLIRTEKLGRVRSCQIEPGGLKTAEQWIAARHTPWERQLDRLGDLLAEEADPES